MGKPESPTPLDPTKLIRDQTTANKDMAGYQFGLNAVDQVNPFGSVDYTRVAGQNGQPDSWTQTTKLNAGEQGVFDANQDARQSVANTARGAAGALDLDPLNRPTYTKYAGAPTLSTAGGGIGKLTRSVDGGPIRNSIANAGQITKSLGTDDYSADRTKVEDALFARLNPQIERDRSSLENRLTQQGIRLGSEAYDRAMTDHGKNVNDARLATILNAGTEQGRMQQLELNAGNFANNAQGQQYSQNANDASFANTAQGQRFGQAGANANLNNTAQGQAFAQTRSNVQDANAAKQQNFQNQTTTTGLNNANKSADFANKVTANGQSINEILSLLGGSQINVPSAGSPPSAGVAGVDTAGIQNNAYNQQWNNYNSQMNQWNSTLGGLFGLGANAALAFSDERLKTDKKRVGTTPGGLGIFSYRYKGTPDKQIGVMAQEALQKQPHAVHEHPSGFLMVDYAGIE
jgi:hypothetical protein